METHFDSYFEKLDEINETIVSEKRCCENEGNYCFEEGIIVCKECGGMINNILDSPEWKNYKSSSGDPTRCGMPSNSLLPQSSLGTTISSRGGNDKMNRINMYQKWNSMPYKERSLYKVFNEIDAKCKSSNLPIVISNTGKSFYRIISETKISRGSNRRGVIAACVYYACKECNVARSANELAECFDIDTKVMTKGCKNFTEIMRMSNSDKKRIQSHKSVTIDDFIERFCHKLELNSNDIGHINKISKLCRDLGLINDNTPPAMASGCILLYSKELNLNLSKKNISDICKISEVTINKCYKKLEIIPEINEYLSKVDRS